MFHLISSGIEIHVDRRYQSLDVDQLDTRTLPTQDRTDNEQIRDSNP
jgi:hypothetical protein